LIIWLANEHLPRAKQHGAGLLIFGLHGDKAHGRTQCSLNNSLRIGHIVLLAFDERIHIDWRDQAYIVSQLLKFPPPAMRRCKRLHGDHTLGLLCHEREKLTS
jgi:hypothetical protein